MLEKDIFILQLQGGSSTKNHPNKVTCCAIDDRCVVSVQVFLSVQ